MKRLLYILFCLLSVTVNAQMTAPAFYGAYRPPTPTGGGGCANTSANTYLTAVAAAGVTPTLTQSNAVCSLITAAEANQNWWATATAVYAPIWSNNTANAINMKAPGTNNLTIVGSPSQGVDGIDWNGTTQYANTGIQAQNLSQNSLTFSIYCQESNTASAADMGVQGGTLAVVQVGTGGSNIQVYINQGSASLVSRGGDTRGYFTSTRTGASVVKIFRNGVQLGTTSTQASVSQGASTRTVYLAAYNSGAASLFSPRKASFYKIGTGVTDLQAAQENTDVEQFHDDLGIGLQ